jgi:hypothetical protein
MISIIIMSLLLLLLIYKHSEGFQDRITFTPFEKPDLCPSDCKIYSFPDEYLTPSITMTQPCGYKQDSFVYPCPSTCCYK